MNSSIPEWPYLIAEHKKLNLRYPTELISQEVPVDDCEYVCEWGAAKDSQDCIIGVCLYFMNESWEDYFLKYENVYKDNGDIVVILSEDKTESIRDYPSYIPCLPVSFGLTNNDEKFFQLEGYGE